MRLPGASVGRRRSFSTRFAVILGVLGVLIAGATAAIPLQLSADEQRSAALDRAADKAGIAFNLLAAQRSALHDYVDGVAQQLGTPLSSGDIRGATAVLTHQSAASGGDDVLGASYGDAVRQGHALPQADPLRTTLLQAAERARTVVVGNDGTPWIMEGAQVPRAEPNAVVFIARPMTPLFVRELGADLGSGADAASLAVVRDNTFMSGSVAGNGTTQQALLPADLDPAMRNLGGSVLVSVGGNDIAASAVDLGGGVALLVSTSVRGAGAFQSNAVVPVAIIAVAMILVALLVVFIVVQRDLQRPLRRLDRAVAALEREQFDVPIPARDDDELGRLGRSFERMRATVRASLAGAEARASIAGELATSQPLQSALQRVCDILRTTTDARTAVIAVDHSDMADAYTVCAGLSADVDAAKLLSGGGPIAAVVEPRSATPVVATAMDGTEEAAAGMREVCSARLAIGGTVLGALALADKADGFNPADVALVAAASEQVALALERYRILAVAQRQASTDELTGLYNYRFLVDYLDQQIALAERLRSSLAVLMLDLDRFKVLNDTHGHHAGDEALRAFAEALRSTVRRSDLAARYGGEEFVVVMSNTEREEAQLVAEKIRRAVAALELQLGGETVRFTVSIGGVAYPDDTGDARQLLELADDALYQAKRSGRDRVRFVSDGQPRRTLAGAGERWPGPHEDAEEHGQTHRPSQ